MSEFPLKESITFFASLYDFVLHVKGLHWNVKGPDFFQLHDFFDDVYNEFLKDIDELAERIRMQDAYPPSTLSHIAELSTLESLDSREYDSGKMVDLFVKNAHIIATQVRDLLCLCDNDIVSQDYYVRILAKLDMYLWKARMFQSR